MITHLFTLYEQLLIIIHCFLIGLFLGITYDSLTIILKNKKLIIRYIIELCYWFLIIFITTKYIINNINYQIRLYSIIFFIVGIIIYYIFLSKKHRIRLYIGLFYLKYKIFPFLKKTLLPIDLIKYIKNFIIRILKKRKKKDEENITNNNSDDN